eukprot:GFUD01079766.1.p1 GENE.GFUD01079766.1~~GFUD01079766.1.p1  ORF type:complete len:509 (-),score=100.35 GFUD01079766.1:63-1589(-)
MENKISKNNRKQTKKENMFSNPEEQSPKRIFMSIFSLKHLNPSSLDKLTIFIGNGKSYSNLRRVNVTLCFKLKNCYRLLNMRNLGKTTSREATPLGDARGVPKQFSTFLRFSKRFSKRYSKQITKSLPIRLEGFRNRSKHSYHSSHSSIQRIQVDNSVNILVLKTRSKHLEIQLNLNIAKMENTGDNPLLDYLFDFIESEDISFSCDDGPTVDLDELWSMLPSDDTDNSDTVSSSNSSGSPNEEFLHPDLQSTSVDSSGVIDQAEFVTDTNQDNNSLMPMPVTLSEQASPNVITVASVPDALTLFTITSPAPSPPISMPQYVIQIPGTNQYQVVQVIQNPQTITLPLESYCAPIPPANIQPVLTSQIPSISLSHISESTTSPILFSPSHTSPSPSLSSSSSPNPISTSACSSSPTPPVMDDYEEMRRKNNMACKDYRNRKKTKQELADEELKVLEQENQVLSMKVRHMESIIRGLRENIITGISQPRGIKREVDDADHPENKRRRCEP